MELSSISAQALSLRLVQSNAEFASLAPRWDALLQQTPTNSIFQSSRYLSLWWKHFGREGNLAILLAEQDGELAGIAPLHICPGLSGVRRHLRHLCFLGTMAVAEGLLFDFIVRPGLEQPVIDAFFSSSSPLFDLSWDLLYLPFPPTASPCVTAFRETKGPLHDRLRFVPQEESPVIEFPADWDSFLATRSSKFRRNLRSSLRALEECAGTQEVRAGQDMSVAEMHQILTGFTSTRWRDERPDPPPRQFLDFESELLEQYHQAGLLEFIGWRKDGEFIALNCALAHGGLLWGYQMAWNPKFAKLSPGQVALASVVRQGISRGYRGLNMLLGGASYKAHWAASSIELCRLEAVRPRSLKANLFDAAKLAKRNLDAWRHLPGADGQASPEKAA